jgi:putative membrane protein
MRWWESASSTWDGTTPWLMFLPMMLWPILVIGGIIAVVMLLMRSGKAEAPPTWRDGRRQTPFDILGERFARGEIDRREYEERKGLLSQP